MSNDKVNSLLYAVSDFYDEYPVDFEMDILTNKGYTIKMKIYETDFTK